MWESFHSRQAGKYKDDPELEEHYLLAAEETASSIDIIWEVLSSNSNQTVSYSGEENIDTEFNKLLSESDFNIDYGEMWSFLSDRKSSLVYNEDFCCDNVYHELLYDSVFTNISKKRFLNQSYIKSDEFEEYYIDLLEGVPEAATESSQSTAKLKVNKGEKAKGKTQNLNNLLIQRLKRLKLESDTIDCGQSEDDKSLVYSCKLCGVQSRRKRSLFMSYVIPEHSKTPSKKPGLTKRRKPKTKVRYMSEIKKTFLCSDLRCDLRFNKRGNRTRHSMTKHGRKDGFRISCGICGKQFTNKFNLARHRLQFHKLAKDVKKCPLCTYVTSRLSNFLRHCGSKHLGLLDRIGYLT